MLPSSPQGCLQLVVGTSLGMQSPFLWGGMSEARFRGPEDMSIPAQENNKGTNCIAWSMLSLKKYNMEPAFAGSQKLLGQARRMSHSG